MPRTKSEDSCPKDKLLDGGTRGKDKKRTGHREVRQYLTWEKDFIDSDEKVFFLGYIKMDSWCVVGIGGATWSGV
jgi:hypothetical protein